MRRSTFVTPLCAISIGLVSSVPALADGRACNDAVQKSNALTMQIKDAEYRATMENECHAETRLWSSAGNLEVQLIAFQATEDRACAGFGVSGEIPIDKMREKLARYRKFERAANTDCDPPTVVNDIMPPVQPVDTSGLIRERIIQCFGGGNCNSHSAPHPSDGQSLPGPLPKNRSTITGLSGDSKSQNTVTTSGVMPAK